MAKKGNMFVLLAFMVCMLGGISSINAEVQKNTISVEKSALPVPSLDKAAVKTSTNIYDAKGSRDLKIDETPLKEAKRLKVQETYGNIPLSFIQNDGQMNEKVTFYERGNGHSTFFTKRGVYLGLTNGQHQSLTDQETKDNAQGDRQQTSTPEQPSSTTEFIRLTPLGANKEPKIIAEGMQKGKVNYFRGNDPENWKTNIPTWQSVVYKMFYSRQKQKLKSNPSFARVCGFIPRHIRDEYCSEHIPSLRKLEQFDQIMRENGIWAKTKVEEVKENIKSGVRSWIFSHLRFQHAFLFFDDLFFWFMRRLYT